MNKLMMLLIPLLMLMDVGIQKLENRLEID